MKTKHFDKTGKEKEVNLPGNFGKIRKDILAKAVEAEKARMSFGSKIGAGAQYSASGIVRHRRNRWKSAYGKGISRIPRKIMSRSGSSFNWIGATVASTRGGRRAHPPKAGENQARKINKKELLIAFNSGFAGTVDGNSIEKKYNEKLQSGFVIPNDVLKMKSKEFYVFLEKIFGTLKRIKKEKSVRAGKGKMRGRKYKSNAGLLFVIGSDEEMKRKGIEVVNVCDLLLKDLAPNGEPGRLTVYTEKALKEIEEVFK